MEEGIKLLPLEKFQLPPAELTDDARDYFRETYDIDLDALSPSIIVLLLNFRVYGASVAIMNLILSLQGSREIETPDIAKEA